mmetsp:Transcript_25807/g.64066  ORF Transcript_25807/g.64066 Transcript_25807/m.64066 type:complete len:216 (+) Transcript_25807:359-1006(+)
MSSTRFVFNARLTRDHGATRALTFRTKEPTGVPPILCRLSTGELRPPRPNERMVGRKGALSLVREPICVLVTMALRLVRACRSCTLSVRRMLAFDRAAERLDGAVGDERTSSVKILSLKLGLLHVSRSAMCCSTSGHSTCSLNGLVRKWLLCPGRPAAGTMHTTVAEALVRGFSSPAYAFGLSSSTVDTAGSITVEVIMTFCCRAPLPRGIVRLV